MSRKDAHAFAVSLAATLMVSIVVFQAGDGTFGAIPADEIDGDGPRRDGVPAVSAFGMRTPAGGAADRVTVESPSKTKGVCLSDNQPL